MSDSWTPPISGGQAGAENGALSIMCGGASEHFDAAAPVMDAYAKSMTLVGPAGSGQRTKMVNQILCAGAIQGAAEALAFGRRAGLDMTKVLAAVTQGAAASWYLNNRGETMLADEFDFGFAVDWMGSSRRFEFLISVIKCAGSSLQATTRLPCEHASPDQAPLEYVLID